MSWNDGKICLFSWQLCEPVRKAPCRAFAVSVTIRADRETYARGRWGAAGGPSVPGMQGEDTDQTWVGVKGA